MTRERLYLYDTTLRDGAQTQGVDFSLEDKALIAQQLDVLGIDYIEAGYPGANPTDTKLFAAPQKLGFAALTAFGMTKRPGRSISNDPGFQAVLAAKAPAICLVGKTWDFHVDVALGITPEENLQGINELVAAVVASGREALLDCEHFFDGYKANPDYALHCAKSAYDAGARWVVLCDTNGGTLPEEIESIVTEVVRGMLEADDADWNAIADEHSDDTGSGSRGGDLGWSDPENSPYVPEFSAALAELEVGEISEPVRSEFGWHVIQKTGERESPQAEAEDIAAQLADDPDSFADAGRAVQRGPGDRLRRRRARLGGALPAERSRRTRSSPSARSARSARSSTPAEAGIVIYRLLETNDSQEIEADRLDEIRANGFERWLDEVVRNGVETWLDPQYEPRRPPPPDR